MLDFQALRNSVVYVTPTQQKLCISSPLSSRAPSQLNWFSFVVPYFIARADAVLPEPSHIRMTVKKVPIVPHSNLLLMSKVAQNCTAMACGTCQPPQRRVPPFVYPSQCTRHRTFRSAGPIRMSHADIIRFKHLRYPFSQNLPVFNPLFSMGQGELKET